MPRYCPRDARRRFRLSDSLHPGADPRYPAGCDFRDGPLGAEARVPYGARHRGSVAARQRGHPDRDRGLHRQHGRTGDEPAALPGPGGGGSRLSRGARRAARADGGPGVRGHETDRTEHDARRPRPEPARRAAPTPLGAQARSMRKLVVLAATLTLTPPGLAAQRAHQYEIGAFGSYTRYDPAFGLAKKVGGGARFGYFVADAVGLEGEVLFQPSYPVPGTDSTLEPIIGSASVVVNLLSGVRNVFYVLGGYSRLDFGNTAPYKFTDNAMHPAAGDRIFLTNRVALRLAVGRAGCPTGADQDGVPAGLDQCPNTPPGARVDATGCPVDSDQDGVPDGIDQCPDTPAGATVDAKGCPSDADNDGVPDGIDRGPHTPTGAKADASGCPIDSEHDRVPDGIDPPPATPA